MTLAVVVAAVAAIILLVTSARAWARGWYGTSAGSLFAACLLGMWAVASPDQLQHLVSLWTGVN